MHPRLQPRAPSFQPDVSQVASPEEVVALAETLSRRLAEMGGLSKRSWYQLFNHMDGDSTGRITYTEFAGVVREELQVSPKELPSDTLRAVWAALDTDSTGFVGAGEFGAFMRRGEKLVNAGATSPRDARRAMSMQVRIRAAAASRLEL